MKIKRISLFGAAVPLCLSLLAGCASIPTQEMSDARQALQAAREANAAIHAPKNFNEAEQRMLRAEKKLSTRDYKSARNNALTARRESISSRNMAVAIAQAQEALTKAGEEGALTEEARALLHDAEAAAQAGDEELAVSTAARAKARALEDLRRAREAREHEQRQKQLDNSSWLERAVPLLQAARQAEERMDEALRQTWVEAETAYENKEGRLAYDRATTLTEGLSALLAASKPGATQAYRVVRGDNLWRIAAKSDVYANPLWWPLIYQANREQLDDSDLLRPGQVLIIDKHPSTAAIARAERHARLRENWRMGVMEKIDQAYLSAAD